MGIVFKFVSRVFYVEIEKEKWSERIKRGPAEKGHDMRRERK